MERDRLHWWYGDGIVEDYLSKNDNSATNWSFLDGPITANNPMGVHHAWGRTYKDLWVRYHTMLGHKQRYQNGFDCQGLWVEVEVERELGFTSKRDIEEYGIDRVRRDVQGTRAQVRHDSSPSRPNGSAISWTGTTPTSRCPTSTTTRSGTS